MVVMTHFIANHTIESEWSHKSLATPTTTPTCTGTLLLVYSLSCNRGPGRKCLHSHIPLLPLRHCYHRTNQSLGIRICWGGKVTWGRMCVCVCVDKHLYLCVCFVLCEIYNLCKT